MPYDRQTPARPRTTIALLLAVNLTACATVTRGPLQRIEVDSRPDGATVALHDCGATVGEGSITPETVLVSRRATRCVIELSKAGYLPVSISLTRKYSPFDPRRVSLEPESPGAGFATTAIVLGYILAGGFIVDWISGAAFELSPDPVAITLPLLTDERESSRPSLSVPAPAADGRDQ